MQYEREDITLSQSGGTQAWCFAISYANRSYQKQTKTIGADLKKSLLGLLWNSNKLVS